MRDCSHLLRRLANSHSKRTAETDLHRVSITSLALLYNLKITNYHQLLWTVCGQVRLSVRLILGYSVGSMNPNYSDDPAPVVVGTRKRPGRFSGGGEGLKSILSTLAILIIAPLIALTLTTFVFQSYEVDGPSMETTLQNKDRLIVLKVPKTWASITGNDYIPNRGDVVVFNYNESFGLSGNQSRQLIKRVVGLPGDRVVVKDGKLTVYNSLHPEGFEPDRTLPYGSVIENTSGDVDVRVEAGYVYVCGDNRDNSLDSRAFGAIKANDIVGKLIFRVFPLNKADLF